MRGSALVVIALVGCGDGATLPDASVPSDADRALVTVQFLSDQSRPDGNAVYFQNVDSSLVLATRTDQDGRANAFMRAGGFVTVVASRGGSQFLYTHADVQPGEPLVIDERFGAFEKQTVFTLRVPAEPGASFYQLYSSCGDQDIRGAELGPLQVVLDDCDGIADLLVVAFGDTVRYLYREDVAVNFTDVVLPGPYRDPTASTITALEVPDPVAHLFVTQSLLARRRALYTLSTTIELVDGAGSAVVEALVPPEGTLLTRVDPSTFLGAISAQHVIDWRPASPVTILDFAALTVRAYTEAPRFEPTSNALRWREDETGAIAEVVRAGLGWTSPAGFACNWNVLAPRTEEPVLRLPVLPRADLVPTANTFIYDLHNFAIEGGYRRVRSTLLGAWHPSNGLHWPAEGEAGRLVFRTLTFNEF